MLNSVSWQTLARLIAWRASLGDIVDAISDQHIILAPLMSHGSYTESASRESKRHMRREQLDSGRVAGTSGELRVTCGSLCSLGEELLGAATAGEQNGTKYNCTEAKDMFGLAESPSCETLQGMWKTPCCITPNSSTLATNATSRACPELCSTGTLKGDELAGDADGKKYTCADAQKNLNEKYPQRCEELRPVWQEACCTGWPQMVCDRCPTGCIVYNQCHKHDHKGLLMTEEMCAEHTGAWCPTNSERSASGGEASNISANATLDAMASDSANASSGTNMSNESDNGSMSRPVKLQTATNNGSSDVASTITIAHPTLVMGTVESPAGCPSICAVGPLVKVAVAWESPDFSQNYTCVDLQDYLLRDNTSLCTQYRSAWQLVCCADHQPKEVHENEAEACERCDACAIAESGCLRADSYNVSINSSTCPAHNGTWCGGSASPAPTRPAECEHCPVGCFMDNTCRTFDPAGGQLNESVCTQQEGTWCGQSAGRKFCSLIAAGAAIAAAMMTFL